MSRDPYRRYSRRMRRQSRRNSAYPMLILGPPEPYAFLVFAAVTRWAYRHRSAFAPFTIAISTAIVAAIVHGHHVRWWVSMMVITIVVTVALGIPHSLLLRRPVGRKVASILGRLWEACGIDCGIERGYAAAVAAVTGGWLSAAIAVSPASKPLPQVAAIGTVVLGIPWWFHRRRRAKVRVERIIGCWPEVAENVGLPGAGIVSVAVDAWGWTARVLLKKGATTEQAIGKIPALESGLGLRPGSIRITSDPVRADRFTMRVVEKDPHANPAPWPGAKVTSVTQGISIGVSEDGHPVQILVLRRNALIGGIMGSGKSVILNDLIASLVGCADVVLWGIDLKGGMELQPWAACFEKLATTPEQAVELLAAAVGWLDERAARKAAEGQRVWEPTPDDPALIVIVDEYAELAAEAHDWADSLARRGRAVAVNLIAATQRPTQDAMGNTAVRSQMDIRICLRVREPRDADLILGQGAVRTGWQAHQLTQPGTFLLSDPEHTIPDRHRAYLISSEQITRQATQHSHNRPCLGALPQQIAHTAPESPQSAERRAPQVPGQIEPETALWTALRNAGPTGISAGALVKVTGKGRTWVYERLRQLAANGYAVQTIRGHWRAASDDAPPGAGTPGDPQR